MNLLLLLQWTVTVGVPSFRCVGVYIQVSRLE